TGAAQGNTARGEAPTGATPAAIPAATQSNAATAPTAAAPTAVPAAAQTNAATAPTAAAPATAPTAAAPCSTAGVECGVGSAAAADTWCIGWAHAGDSECQHSHQCELSLFHPDHVKLLPLIVAVDGLICASAVRSARVRKMRRVLANVRTDFERRDVMRRAGLVGLAQVRGWSRRACARGGNPGVGQLKQSRCRGALLR